MGKRKRLLLTLGCAVLAVVLIITLTSEHEPSAHGKPLSYWVEVYAGFPTPKGRSPTPQEQREAEVAIKQIGTNAIPFFLEWMDYKPAQWKFDILAKTRKLPNWMFSRLAKWLFGSAGPERAMEAALSFRVLGPIAAPAVPELEIRAQANDQEIRGRALFALSNIGPTAASAMRRVLSTLLSNPQSLTYPFVAHSIEALGPNARPMIPLLVQYLDHTNAVTAGACAGMLGHLRLEPDLVVPALLRKLSDPRGTVSNQAASALADFGRPALTQITNALSDPDPVVRQNATNAIARINARRRYAGPSSPFE